MKFLDLLLMSVQNLRRRKLRTALTVLGVVIGTASIVVMVSIGMGLNKFTVEQITSYGSLTEINVYNYGYWGSSDSDPLYMTDDTMKDFSRIPHVTSVSPLLQTSIYCKQGVYEGYVNLMGVTREYLEQIPLKEGALPPEDSKEMLLVIGNQVQRNFRNPKSNEDYWSTGELPDIDFMGQPLFAIFDMDAYYQAQGGGGRMPKKYMLNTAALEADDVQNWNYSYNAYTDIEVLKTTLRKIFKKKAIPGQPTNKKGKPYNYFIYDEAVVYVDDMDNVSEVQEQITSMGFQANSNMEWLESSQKQSNMVQAVLGGIGAVSLFVAAIGIANTMMMSIYERTKEIGVIKVLGCAMGNIRSMFLIEAGFIGFIGGFIGVSLSYLISVLINKFLASSFLYGAEGQLSYIPPWLGLAGMGFAVLVGMVAGFFPALRAMKLSPLAAIRND